MCTPSWQAPSLCCPSLPSRPIGLPCPCPSPSPALAHPLLSSARRILPLHPNPQLNLQLTLPDLLPLPLHPLPQPAISSARRILAPPLPSSPLLPPSSLSDGSSWRSVLSQLIPEAAPGNLGLTRITSFLSNLPSRSQPATAATSPLQPTQVYSPHVAAPPPPSTSGPDPAVRRDPPCTSAGAIAVTGSSKASTAGRAAAAGVQEQDVVDLTQDEQEEEEGGGDDLAVRLRMASGRASVMATATAHTHCASSVVASAMAAAPAAAVAGGRGPSASSAAAPAAAVAGGRGPSASELDEEELGSSTSAWSLEVVDAESLPSQDDEPLAARFGLARGSGPRPEGRQGVAEDQGPGVRDLEPDPGPGQGEGHRQGPDLTLAQRVAVAQRRRAEGQQGPGPGPEPDLGSTAGGQRGGVPVRPPVQGEDGGALPQKGREGEGGRAVAEEDCIPASMVSGPGVLQQRARKVLLKRCGGGGR